MGSGINTASNSELRSMLQNAMGQLNSLGFNKASLSSIGGSGNDLSRSLWTIAGEAEAAIDGNDDQKAQASINILQGLLSMVLGGNHQDEANKGVKENYDAITKNSSEESKKSQELKAKLDGFAANISANTENINEALKNLDSLGNKSGDIEEKRQQILEQLKIIETKKQELYDPKKREEALKAIGAAAATIDSLVENLGQIILNMQQTVEEQNAVIEQNVNEATQSITESAKQISSGVADFQKYIQKNSNEGAKATKITTQGATDIPTGEAEVSVGQATNSNMFSALFSGGQGVKLILDGNQRINAGNIRISGGAQNLSLVVKSIGDMGQDISSLSDMAGGLGKIGDGVLNLVGQYQTKSESYINAIGSFDIEGIVSANAALQAQVQTWQGSTASEDSSAKDDTNKGDKDSNNPNSLVAQVIASGTAQDGDAVANMKTIVEKAKFGI